MYKRQGIPCAEVTFRTACAADVIKIMTTKYPELLVGAGTVLTTEQVDRAVEAGAKFIVSPGLNPKVVKYCVDKGIPVTPGTSNPSDVEQAIELGLEVVKFFPAEQAGGLAMIKAMSAPYVNMKFMPTGGINADNLTSYLDFKKIIACGGSWMVKGDMIKAGEFDKIKDMTAEAVAAEAKLKQAKSDDVKDKVGKTLKDIFVPGHKVFGDIGTALDNATGCKKSTSRYDAAINELAGSKNVQVTNDSELSK